jgi:hypothetical protein
VVEAPAKPAAEAVPVEEAAPVEVKAPAPKVDTMAADAAVSELPLRAAAASHGIRSPHWVKPAGA